MKWAVWKCPFLLESGHNLSHYYAMRILALCLCLAGCSSTSPHVEKPALESHPESTESQSDVASEPVEPVVPVAAAVPEPPPFLVGLTQIKAKICACDSMVCVNETKDAFRDLPVPQASDIPEEFMEEIMKVATELEGCVKRLAPTPVLAPEAFDLAAYTEGVPGKGALHARIRTSKGAIVCRLAETEAPQTVANFVGLARGLHPFRDPKTGETVKRQFYDGLIFHRVIPDFMIQGGDPMGTGMGGPGYTMKTSVSPKLKHSRAGTLAMANSGPNTDGSQFYITEIPKPDLDGSYSVFGYCKNRNVVRKIARVESEATRPMTDVVIEGIDFFRRR